MATKPMAWQEQSPVNSLDELVNESWVKGNSSKTRQDKKAPKAEPEEDIDVLEPGTKEKTLQENQNISKIKMANATKMENEEPTRISQCTSRVTEEVVTELEQVSKKLTEGTEEEPEEPVDLCEEAFPPPPSLGGLSTGEYCDKEGFSSLEAEVSESISDVEAISDPTEDLTSLDSQNSPEWPKTSHITEPVVQKIASSSEEMTVVKHVLQFHVLLDGINTHVTENKTSQSACHFPSDNNNPGNIYTVSSPPFADECEEEEEDGFDIMELNTLDVNSKAFQPSTKLDSAWHANPSGEQQEVLLPKSRYEPGPRGANQEAARQVLGQGSPPLSAVPMELANQGGALSQGCACVVGVRERHSRAGEKTENEQTGGAEGQKESGLERSKPAGQQHGRGLLRYSQTVQIQVLEIEKHSCGVSLKHSRMENDSCDDSQSDSGVSADFSPSSTLEGTAATVSRETPIEREIRRAVEREHSLRRSRGLPNLPTSKDYVEVPIRKAVLSHSVTAKSEWSQDKDREFAGKKMLYEIQAEAQREQDLVKLGKIPGFYDKGTVRQIKEKKQLFEAFQKPSDSTVTISTRSKAPSSSASNVSTLKNQEDISSQVSTIGGPFVEKRHNIDVLSPAQSPKSPRGEGVTRLIPQGSGFAEGTGRQVIIIENNRSVPAQKRNQDKPEAITVVDSGNPYTSSSRRGGYARSAEIEQKKEEEEDISLKENPFFKLRSSKNLVKVKQDIQEAQKREKELHRQRISLYGGSVDGGAQGEGGGERGRPVSMEVKSPMLSLNGHAVSDRPGSSSKVETGPSAARLSVSKSYVWPPAQAEDEKINQPEVLQSPRTPRQKTPLVQLWESGLVNGQNKEQD